MKNVGSPGRASRIVLMTALLAVLGSAASAQTLTYNRIPISNAVAHIQSRFGINISLKGNIDPNRPISFSILDSDAPAARLHAVNALANAIGADFQKIFVISKMAPDQIVSPVKVDTDAPVVFKDADVSAEDAIRAVAAVDNAVPEISGPITGTVTFSDTTLTASQAADEIARQTRTQWKPFYAIMPRGQDLRLQGTVVGQTNGGLPITKSPYTVYRRGPSYTERQRAAEAAAAQQEAQAQAQNPQTADNNTNANPNGNYPYGNYGYGPYGYSYGPYGYNPYGSSPYGYNPYAYGPAMIAPGVSYSPTPLDGFQAGGTTVLPSFPYGGSGPIIINNGYGDYGY